MLFCKHNYDLIDAVCVFALHYKYTSQIKQALNYKAEFDAGEEIRYFHFLMRTPHLH